MTRAAMCRLAKPILALLLAAVSATAAIACVPKPGAVKQGRTIALDTRGGPTHGSVNYGPSDLLKPGEVILTFDDGPLPGRTEPILRALDAHCVKATFFAVGTMSMANPRTIRAVAARGHTIAGHTWNHANLGRTGFAGGKDQIERGFAAVEAVIGQPLAPIFRFPYLRDTRALVGYLKERDIASISIDVDSGDTRGFSKQRIIEHTMRQLKRRGKGILLFHDIKRNTAAAMPALLDRLAKGGYRVVHLAPAARYRSKPALLAAYKARLESRRQKVARRSAPRRLAKVSLPRRRPSPDRVRASAGGGLFALWSGGSRRTGSTEAGRSPEASTGTEANTTTRTIERAPEEAAVAETQRAAPLPLRRAAALAQIKRRRTVAQASVPTAADALTDATKLTVLEKAARVGVVVPTRRDAATAAPVPRNPLRARAGKPDVQTLPVQALVKRAVAAKVGAATAIPVVAVATPPSDAGGNGPEVAKSEVSAAPAPASEAAGKPDAEGDATKQAARAKTNADADAVDAAGASKPGSAAAAVEPAPLEAKRPAAAPVPAAVPLTPKASLGTPAQATDKLARLGVDKRSAGRLVPTAGTLNPVASLVQKASASSAEGARDAERLRQANLRKGLLAPARKMDLTVAPLTVASLPRRGIRKPEDYVGLPPLSAFAPAPAATPEPEAEDPAPAEPEAFVRRSIVNPFGER